MANLVQNVVAGKPLAIGGILSGPPRDTAPDGRLHRT